MTEESREDDPQRPDDRSDSGLSATRKAAWDLQRDLLEMAKEEDTPEPMRAVLLERVRLVQDMYAGLEESRRWTREQERNLLMLELASANNRLVGESNNTAKALKNWTIVLAAATVVLAFATLALIFATLAA